MEKGGDNTEGRSATYCDMPVEDGVEEVNRATVVPEAGSGAWSQAYRELAARGEPGKGRALMEPPEEAREGLLWRKQQ